MPAFAWRYRGKPRETLFPSLESNQGLFHYSSDALCYVIVAMLPLLRVCIYVTGPLTGPLVRRFQTQGDFSQQNSKIDQNLYDLQEWELDLVNFEFWTIQPTDVVGTFDNDATPHCTSASQMTKMSNLDSFRHPTWVSTFITFRQPKAKQYREMGKPQFQSWR